MSHASMQSDVANLFTQANATLTSKKQLAASGAQQLDFSTSDRNFGGGSMLSEFARMRLNLEQDLTQRKKDVAVSGPWPVNSTAGNGSLSAVQNGAVHYDQVRFVGKGVSRGRTKTTVGLVDSIESVNDRATIAATGNFLWRIYAPPDEDITINGNVECTFYKSIKDDVPGSHDSGARFGYKSGDQYGVYVPIGRDTSETEIYVSAGTGQSISLLLAFRDWAGNPMQNFYGVGFRISNRTIRAGEYMEIGINVLPQTVTNGAVWVNTYLPEHLYQTDLILSYATVTGVSGTSSTVYSDYIYPSKINQLCRNQVDELNFGSIKTLANQYNQSVLRAVTIMIEVQCSGGGTFYAITTPISALGCDPAVSGSPSLPTSISRDVSLYQYCTVSRQNPLLQYRGFWTHGYLGYWKNYPTPFYPAPYPLGYMGYGSVKDEYSGYYGGQAFYNWDQGGGTSSPYAAFVDHFNTNNRTFTSKENKVIDIIANGGPLGPGLATSYHIPNYPVRRDTLGDYRPLETEHPSGTLDAVKHSAIYSVTVRRLPVKSGQFYLQQTPTSALTVQFGCFVSGTFETIFTATVPQSEKEVTVYPFRVIIFDDVPLFWKCDSEVFISATICKPAIGYQVVFPLTRAHYSDTKTLLDSINN